MFLKNFEILTKEIPLNDERDENGCLSDSTPEPDTIAFE